MDNFDDIRPFTPEETPSAIEELIGEEYFKKALSYVTPDVESMLQKFPVAKNPDEFQQGILFPVLKWLIGLVSLFR